MYKRILFVLFILYTSTAFSQRDFKKSFPSIDKYVDSIMRDWNIPGLALGIVYKNSLIYSKGYGYRDVENKLPVTTTTLFPIASNTKLFTATVAAMLAEEGKLDLDKPVRNYMPSLSFYNDELNTKVTLRDMLSHRTGLPRYDAIWAGSQLTRKEAISKVVYMRPQLSFREGYIYNNMMYAAAGAVLENVTGKTWETLVREKLFMPLEMSRSGFWMNEMKRDEDAAWSYFEADTTRKLFQKKYEAQSEALGPAGTIKSSVEDMSRWMIAQLNNGMYKGKQVIPGNVIKETLVPNIISDKENKYNELSNSLYSLGRGIQTYKGYKTTNHTGSIDGFYSSLFFISSEGLGVFMVHNGERGGLFRSAMALPIVDRLLGLNISPWSQRYLAENKSAITNSFRITDSINASNIKGTTTSHPLSAFEGNYANPIYGNLKIEQRNGQLYVSFRKITLPLHHFHYDQFYTKRERDDSPTLRLSFLTNEKGAIDKITTRLTPGENDVFVKK